MRLFPSLVALGGLGLALTGLVLATLPVEPGRVPRETVVGSTAPPPVRPSGPATVPEQWANPWHRPTPAPVPAPLVAIKPVEPAPAPVVPAPPPPNTTALSFLGKVLKDDQTTVYYFKEKSSGLVVGLVPGQPKSGWTLGPVGETSYKIEGPGGSYEVRR